MITLVIALSAPIVLALFSITGPADVLAFALSAPLWVIFLAPIGGALNGRARRRKTRPARADWVYGLGAIPSLLAWLVGCAAAVTAFLSGAFSLIYCSVDECYWSLFSDPELPASAGVAFTAFAASGALAWWLLVRPVDRKGTAALALGGIGLTIALVAADLAFGGPILAWLRESERIWWIDVTTGARAVRTAGRAGWLAFALGGIGIALALVGSARKGSIGASSEPPDPRPRRGRLTGARWAGLVLGTASLALGATPLIAGSGERVPPAEAGELEPLLAGDGRSILMLRCADIDESVLVLRTLDGRRETIVSGVRSLNDFGQDAFGLSDDAERIVFVDAPDADPYGSGAHVMDVRTGEVRLVSGPEDYVGEVEISGDGRTVTWGRPWKRALYGLFVRDLATDQTQPASVSPEGRPLDAFHPVLSDDGRVLAFIGCRPDENQCDVFARDLTSGTTVAADARLAMDEIQTSAPSMSDDGDLIAFWARHGRGGWGVHLWDTHTGEVTLVDRSGFPLSVRLGMGAPRGGGVALSGSGRFVVASAPVAGGGTAIYAYDRSRDRAHEVWTGPDVYPWISISDDGRRLAITRTDFTFTDYRVGILDVRTGTLTEIEPGNRGL